MNTKEVEVVDQAHNRREAIIALKGTAKEFLFRLGRELYLADQNSDHEALDFDSWKALVVAPEISGGYEMGLDTASKLKTVYEHYVIGKIATLQQLIKLGEPFKLYEARNWITEKSKLSDAILPLSEIKELMSGKPVTKCDHSWQHVEYWQCDKCSFRLRTKPD
jgi:hypothetical protein